MQLLLRRHMTNLNTSNKQNMSTHFPYTTSDRLTTSKRNSTNLHSAINFQWKYFIYMKKACKLFLVGLCYIHNGIKFHLFQKEKRKKKHLNSKKLTFCQHKILQHSPFHPIPYAWIYEISTCEHCDMQMLSWSNAQEEHWRCLIPSVPPFRCCKITLFKARKNLNRKGFTKKSLWLFMPNVKGSIGKASIWMNASIRVTKKY